MSILKTQKEVSVLIITPSPRELTAHFNALVVTFKLVDSCLSSTSLFFQSHGLMTSVKILCYLLNNYAFLSSDKSNL